MKKLLVGTTALAGAVVSAPICAQGGGLMQRDQTRVEAQQRADMLFQILDANRDGLVSRTEAEQAAARFQAQRGGESGGRPGRMQRMLDQVFGAAQSVSRQQFEAQLLARFDAQDLNHDGVVTAAEREELRQRRIEARQQSGSTPPAPALPPAVQPHQ